MYKTTLEIMLHLLTFISFPLFLISLILMSIMIKKRRFDKKTSLLIINYFIFAIIFGFISIIFTFFYGGMFDESISIISVQGAVTASVFAIFPLGMLSDIAINLTIYYKKQPFGKALILLIAPSLVYLTFLNSIIYVADLNVNTTTIMITFILMIIAVIKSFLIKNEKEDINE